MRRIVGKLISAVAALVVFPTAVWAEPLRVVGNVKVLEIAPLVLASEASGGQVEFALGGVPNLWDLELAGLTVAVAGDASKSAPPSTRLADLAGNAETQLLRATIAHPDGRYLLTVTEGIYRIVARRSRGIATEADLKGKRVATYPGTSAAFYLHKALQRANLTEKDITIVTLSPQASEDALIAGSIDAMATWEPHSERALRKLGDEAVLIAPPQMYREIYSLHTTQAVLDNPQKRAAIVAYVKNVLQACRGISADPSHAQSLLRSLNGYSPDQITQSWHFRFPCEVTPNLLDKFVEEDAWLAAQDGRAPRTRAQLARLIDTSIYDEARRAAK
jgi:NitT/TauT family transport system substrate-binding protein